MSALHELYQQVIIDHTKTPHNYGKLDGANCRAEGFNPLCGDHYFVELLLDGDKILDIHFYGSGCALSKASASLMTTVLKGKTKNEAENFFEKFQKYVTGEKITEESDIGKLAVFSGVREFPVRVKCVMLPWYAMKSALQGNVPIVSTE